jgi:hypothetical protein
VFVSCDTLELDLEISGRSSANLHWLDPEVIWAPGKSVLLEEEFQYDRLGAK